MSDVRVRFAPSPTGSFHVGGARTALYNKIFADKFGGVFYLRIEDTDQLRFKENSVNELIESLAWLGITWDEGPSEQDLLDLKVKPEYANVYGKHGAYSYVQSKRRELYYQHVTELLERGLAYPVFVDGDVDLESGNVRFSKLSQALEIGRWREASKFMIKKAMNTGQPYYILLKLPRDGGTVVEDYLRGKIEFPWNRAHDLVILKPDGLPTYHMASVIDDHYMKTSHVIRGSEWLPSLPVHFFLYDCLEWGRPIFVHLPVILNPSGKGKMSKRNGQEILDLDGKTRVPIYVLDYKKEGYIPEAMCNFMALTGWNPKNEREIMSYDEIVSHFELKHIGKTGAAWNFKKLLSFNKEYMRAMSSEDFAYRAEKYM